MNSVQDGEKREKFKELLLRLAQSQTILRKPEGVNEIYDELESIYYAAGKAEKFRHYYSDIFAVLCQIDREPKLGDTEILSQNMNLIFQKYEPRNVDPETKEKIDICKEINKLYDHINLDIARINYSKGLESEIDEKLQRLDDSIVDMEGNIKKAGEMQNQYVTILGIFAAIVLAFTGGIAFSTSVLENISASSIYRILLVVMGLAFVLINVIYLLTRFILEIHKRPGESIDYPAYMIILNGICIGVVVLIVLCWVFDLGRAAEIFRDIIYS